MAQKRYEVRATEHLRLRYAVVDTWKNEKPEPRYQSHREACERADFLNANPRESRYVGVR
jgi:hypothetical protein